MAVAPEADCLEVLLKDLSAVVGARYPHLFSLFDVFSSEARFGRRWIAPSLDKLPHGARILEVGGGLMLLGSALQCEGFDVTVLEPIGAGFSAFTELQGIVLEYASIQGFSPHVLPTKAEEIEIISEFDFAFSVNVMEHVDDVGRTLEHVVASLKSSAVYRFTCPNYLFPYEPHFNIPTLFSKRLTERVMKRRIFESATVTDPAGTWISLNWISVPQVVRATKCIPGARAYFDRDIVSSIFERMISDAQFSARRSSLIRAIANVLVTLRAHRLLSRFPASILPIIDCSISCVDT